MVILASQEEERLLARRVVRAEPLSFGDAGEVSSVSDRRSLSDREARLPPASIVRLQAALLRLSTSLDLAEASTK